jgi:hypothetical protein
MLGIKQKIEIRAILRLVSNVFFKIIVQIKLEKPTSESIKIFKKWFPVSSCQILKWSPFKVFEHFV